MWRYFIANDARRLRKRIRRMFTAVTVVMAGVALAQVPREARPSAPAAGAGAEEVKIVVPVVDKAHGSVTLPGAFWNQHLADWLDVAFCGRPSDFLHETVVCATTTRTLVEKALRDVGCRDGDEWADSMKQFARVRGDRLMVTLEFERAGKKEVWSLDELMTFQGWGVAVGPYGFMYKGDPGAAGGPGGAATTPAAAGGPAEGAAAAASDGTKILRDDPQIAVAFKGIQNASQSFADHPLAYDDWVYPSFKLGRNYNALPTAVYDSNGTIPVTITLRHVTEEQLLTESAKVWHDAAFAQFVLKQVPIAQQIDTDKAAFLKNRAKQKAAEPARVPMDDATARALWGVEAERAVLLVDIEKNYAALDAAWAAWAADHARFVGEDARVLADLKQEAARWKEHGRLMQVRAEQLALAERASLDPALLPNGPPMDAAKELKMQQARGREINARSAALRAGNQQPREYWAEALKNLDPKDPRETYVKDVRLHVDLTDAREAAAKLGIDYGDALAISDKAPAGGPVAALGAQYAAALGKVSQAETRLELFNVTFEISKREGFEGDPDLPGLKKRRDELEAKLKELEAASATP